jgi:hypothetical protein
LFLPLESLLLKHGEVFEAHFVLKRWTLLKYTLLGGSAKVESWTRSWIEKKRKCLFVASTSGLLTRCKHKISLWSLWKWKNIQAWLYCFTFVYAFKEKLCNTDYECHKRSIVHSQEVKQKNFLWSCLKNRWAWLDCFIFTYAFKKSFAIWVRKEASIILFSRGEPKNLFVITLRQPMGLGILLYIYLYS